MKKYTPFEPAKIGVPRVHGSATASNFNPKDAPGLDILSTNVSLSSTGGHNFNYSSSGKPLATIKEAQLFGRRKGLPLEIPAIDHKRAARKLG